MIIVRNNNVKSVTFGDLKDFVVFGFSESTCIKIPEVIRNNTKYKCICLSTNEFIRVHEQSQVFPLYGELHVSRPINVKEFIIEDEGRDYEKNP